MHIENTFIGDGYVSEPEFKDVGSGENTFRKASFRISLSNQGAKKNEETGYYDTSWVPVTALGKTAEIFEEQYSKGSRVKVMGEIKVDSWKNEEGENRSFIHVKADRLKAYQTGKALAAAASSSSSTDDFEDDDEEMPPF